MACAFLIVMLTGCASNFGGSDQPVVLPAVPTELTQCFNDKVPAPKAGPMSRQEVYDLIARLKKSETKMSQCGQRFELWYKTLAVGISTKVK